MDRFPDPLALLRAGLADGLAVVRPKLWIADTLPMTSNGVLDEARLPAVWLHDDIPGSSTDRPWTDDLPLTDLPAFDVDVLGLASSGKKALYDLVAEVRACLFTLPSRSPHVRKVREDERFTRRPDYNPRVLRVGGEYTLRLSR